MTSSGVFSPISREATAIGIAEQLAEQHRISTDPNWCADSRVAERVDGRERSGEGTVPFDPPSERSEPEASRVGAADAPTPSGPVRRPPPQDGRRLRKVESRAAVLAACRTLMAGGIFRPSMVFICQAADRSVRTGFEVFPSVEAIHVEAIADGPTRAAVIGRLVDNADLLEDSEIDNIVRAVIRGR